MTFLSMFTAREDNEAQFARSVEFVEAVRAWARRMPPFPISFSGLTASPAAIMVQGFTDAARLNAARDELRIRDLGAGLDQRYRLEVAHMTVVRFRQALRDGKAFAGALEGMRSREFGLCEVTALDLAKSDWYMSRETIEDSGHFRLGDR